MLEAAKEALQDELYASFRFANEALMAITFFFAKQMLIGMIHNGTLDESLERNIERWTQS